VGFAVEAVSGHRAVLAHVTFPGPPRVGRYGVDLEAFESIALPALSGAGSGNLLVIDELGKMELASRRFVEAVGELFDGRSTVVATVHLFRHPLTDGLKAREDVETIRVTRGNRDALPEQLGTSVTTSSEESSTKRRK
jgi:nucleoside-triphosphatase